MADEPRRSGRATKGQHTKDREENDGDGKKKGKGKGRKAKAEPEPEEEEEEDEIIRCVCGQYEEEEDNPRTMICCDNCHAWQHNDCMGLPEDYQPAKYYCEQCKPENHKKLLAAMKQGKKPWEEVARRREAAEAEKSAKKKGKKGRKSGASLRGSEVRGTPTAEPEETTSRKRKLADSPSPDTKAKKARPSIHDDDEDDQAANGQADANESQEAEMDEPKPETSDSILTDVAKNAKDISNPTRRTTATRIIKPFVEQTEALVKDGAVSLAKGDTAQTLGTRIALEVEHAVYFVRSGGSGEPSNAYKEHIRTILNNMKTNTNLAVRLMNKTLPADKLAEMEAQDMATDEQKQQDADDKMNMEKQHVLTDEQERGPRIRRTHKGEEYVDENVQVPESASTAPVRKQAVAADGSDIKSPTQTSVPAKPQPLRKPSATGKGQPFRDPRRKSSSNFDLEKVWSGVQGSPTEAEAPRLPDGQQSPSAPVQPSATTDPEIDNLLKDEENESEPYSPKDFEEEGVVWRGRVNGGNLGAFAATAKFAAGCQPDVDNLRMTWNEVLPAEIKLHGRIQPSKADEYLCGLEYSSTTELIIVSIGEPKDPEEKIQFEKFFNYLKQKERYGVGMQHQVPAIKDIYLLPMDVGQPLPMVMRKLEHQFADPIQERSFIVPIVIKWTDLPHNAERVQLQQEAIAMSPSVGPPVAQTPITPHESQMQFQQFPQPTPQGAQPMNGGVPPAQMQYTTPPPQGPAAHAPVHAPIQQQQPAAAVNAMRVLGAEMAALPAVVNLIAQAPDAGEKEFTVIKECIEENAEAGRSLPVLTQMLTAKYHSQRSSKENGASKPQKPAVT